MVWGQSPPSGSVAGGTFYPNGYGGAAPGAGGGTYGLSSGGGCGGPSGAGGAGAASVPSTGGSSNGGTIAGSAAGANTNFTALWGIYGLMSGGGASGNNSGDGGGGGSGPAVPNTYSGGVNTKYGLVIITYTPLPPAGGQGQII
jgi:hypothetical protein